MYEARWIKDLLTLPIIPFYGIYKVVKRYHLTRAEKRKYRHLYLSKKEFKKRYPNLIKK